jgi:hypothetical protein
MHRAPFARTQRRTRSAWAAARTLRTRTLKNGLARNWTSGSRTHRSSRGASLRCRSYWTWRRSLVYRARSGLRDNHSWRRRLRRTGNGRGRRWTRRCRRSLRRGRSRGCRRRGRRRLGWSNDNRRRWCRGTGGRRNGRRRCCRWLFNWRRNHCRPHWSRRRSGNRSSSRRSNWRRSWPCCWCGWCNYRLCHNRRRCRTNWWRGGRGRFLLLCNRLQHISGTRDVRQINLGFYFFFAAQWACGARRRGLRFSRAADMDSNFFSFMLLQRTGMGLLLRHSDER